MPTYEYACGACGHQWEQVQRIVEPPIDVCPKCTKSAAHRLISGGTHFILKGGGWYSDLYSSSKPPAKAAESGGDSAVATPAEGAKGESGKTEGKGDAKVAAPAASPTTATPSTPSSAPSSAPSSS